MTIELSGKKLKAKVERTKEIEYAIKRGLARAEDHGFTMMHDVYICIMGDLDRAGFKIVKKPQGKEEVK